MKKRLRFVRSRFGCSIAHSSRSAFRKNEKPEELTHLNLQIEFGQLMMDVIGDLTNNPSSIEIKIFGDDADLLRTKAEEIKQMIASVLVLPTYPTELSFPVGHLLSR